MRIAVFAEVHADLDGLRLVLSDIAMRRIDETWSLGDLVGGGQEPAACARLVREWCTLTLAGDHDLWAARDGTTGTRCVTPSPASPSPEEPVALDGELRAWLASLRPDANRYGVDCFHGGPKNPVMQWIRTPRDAAPHLLAPAPSPS
jgi:hypothetical protein